MAKKTENTEVQEVVTEEVVEEVVEAAPVKEAPKPAKTSSKIYPACHESIRDFKKAMASIGEKSITTEKVKKIAAANGIDPEYQFKEFKMLKLLKAGKLIKA